ncbi:hypothetical protein MAPG_09777 [Magnaporthiopsis poae ATCC 64411]|uniref:Uncharacterized protein n=1 Tax=Magnaporthiopsis poae (strain ATCC 64411 / 73-15) TaxID=644358 RepID=A0A0C4EAU6_MAGP6|nr:hypothetical protein MAPG_09777 [Magnaporthiopsis poae ATCC 64411]
MACRAACRGFQALDVLGVAGRPWAEAGAGRVSRALNPGPESFRDGDGGSLQNRGQNPLSGVTDHQPAPAPALSERDFRQVPVLTHIVSWDFCTQSRHSRAVRAVTAAGRR